MLPALIIIKSDKNLIQGILSPKILTDHLAHSQPGGQIMPSTLLFTSQIFRLSYGPLMKTFQILIAWLALFLDFCSMLVFQ